MAGRDSEEKRKRKEMVVMPKMGLLAGEIPREKL